MKPKDQVLLFFPKAKCYKKRWRRETYYKIMVIEEDIYFKTANTAKKAWENSYKELLKP